MRAVKVPEAPAVPPPKQEGSQPSAVADESPAGPADGGAAAPERRPVPAPSRGRPATPRSGETELSEQRLKQIYSQYVNAKRAASESTAGITFEKLAQSLKSQAEKLKAAHPTRSVDYRVVMKNGKPVLKPILR
jgi:hypothetical protein